MYQPKGAQQKADAAREADEGGEEHENEDNQPNKSPIVYAKINERWQVII